MIGGPASKEREHVEYDGAALVSKVPLSQLQVHEVAVSLEFHSR